MRGIIQRPKCPTCKGTRNIAADGPDPLGVPKGHPSLVACPRCQRDRHERYIDARARRALRAMQDRRTYTDGQRRRGEV